MGKTLNLSGEEICALEHALRHCIEGTYLNHKEESVAISTPVHKQALQRVLAKMLGES